MKVLKFGGTSVGTVESLKNVKKIVESNSEPCIVVVSALGGLTDMLIKTAKTACKGDVSYRELYEGIVTRHNNVIAGIVPTEKQEEVHKITDPLLTELGDIFQGISLIKDLSQRTLDIVVSYGERLSSVIISRIITGARHFDSRNFIKTNTKFGKHTLNNAATAELIHQTFDSYTGKFTVVPGLYHPILKQAKLRTSVAEEATIPPQLLPQHSKLPCLKYGQTLTASSRQIRESFQKPTS